MRFNYSTTSSTQNEFDSLPRIPLVLNRENHSIEANGLVDSGATFTSLGTHVKGERGKGRRNCSIGLQPLTG
jgi:hypothetical protein